MHRTIITKTLLATLALVVFMQSAYGQNDPPQQVVGTWTKSMNGTTARFEILSGHTWEVEFTGDDEADVYGSYEISGDRITFSDEGGAYSSDASGVYEFKVDDTSLTFTIVDDPVNGRSMLVQGAWTRAGDRE